MQELGMPANGGSAGNRQRNFGNFLRGEIIGKDAQTITIKLADSGSKIIFLSGDTKINKAVAGTQDDLALGKTISVNGTNNADGSVTATQIQLGQE